MACLCETIAGNKHNISHVCIGQHWLFKGLNPDEKKEISQGALRTKLVQGQMLFREGDSANELFLIKYGRVKLSKLLENGNELTLDIREPGDFVGETLLSSEGRYPVNAVSLEETMTCGFQRSHFERLVMQHPQIGLKVISNLSDRLTWLTERAGDLTITNIEDRLYRVLCNVAKLHGMPGSKGIVIQFPLTHEELSFLTGAHRVTISRAMKALRESGKVSHQGKTLILSRIDSL